MQQSEGNLQGSASYITDKSLREANGRGPIDGTLSGNLIEFTAYWSSANIGNYKGTIGATGRIEGWTKDKTNPGNGARWYSLERMKCLVTAETEPSSSTKKSKRLGKIKPKVDPNSAEALQVDQGEIVGTVEGSLTCKPGFVWRVARPEDLVCVTPKARARTAKENTRAAEFVDPDGAYGPNSCIQGYVWREAFEGDGVCVTPKVRDLVLQENSLGPSRRVAD